MNNFLKTLFGIRATDHEVGSIGKRIDWEPASARAGDKVNIRYDGFLKDAGANELYLHYGFDGWSNNIQTAKMETNEGYYSVSVDSGDHSELNFCFKDSANNWDNNYGWNWNVGLK